MAAGDIIDFEARDNVALDVRGNAAMTRPYALQTGLFQHLSRAAPLLSPDEAGIDGLAKIDPVLTPPNPLFVHRLGAATCLQLGLLPWRQVGATTVVLTARPGQLRRHIDRLTAALGPVRLAYCTEAALKQAVLACAGPGLVTIAEAQVPRHQSSRSWNGRRAGQIAVVLTLALLGGLLTAPASTFAALCGLAISVMLINAGLRLVAVLAALRHTDTGPVPAAPVPVQLPVVSILIALYRETAIAGALLDRLARLDYPAHLLDICLILEDDDDLTGAALTDARLPANAQIITVPRGTIRTKPRALNFALNFARGSIIGIYDAEDAPAPDQIRRVVQRFAERGPDVACLQGILDFYHYKTNWLARCFALEYATWFRLYLPGIARLGLVIPLGGTTLFLRRHALQTVGGWDAHNVTEDADLGVRLARAGFRTEIIKTVTEEEPNARLWPWIKQRSRWLKGYYVTWAVHMRAPRALWRDLGPLRFIGFQVQFLGTVAQFLLAPLIWSFWLLALGLPHPVTAWVGPSTALGLAIVFLSCQIIDIVMCVIATRRAGKAGLAFWSPVLLLYFPLATIAAWKGLAQCITRPHFWDKTTHGLVAAPVRNRHWLARFAFDGVQT